MKSQSKWTFTLKHLQAQKNGSHNFCNSKIKDSLLQQYFLHSSHIFWRGMCSVLELIITLSVFDNYYIEFWNQFNTLVKEKYTAQYSFKFFLTHK